MILFFRTPQNSVIATLIEELPSAEVTQQLCWLYGQATCLGEDHVEGWFVGPRREMVTPWSTNAVEITQNMGIKGIVRIEEYFPAQSENSGHDPMLQRMYNGLDQEIFTTNIQPEGIRLIEDLKTFNEEEGLALSAEEIDYLHSVEQQNGRKLTDSEVFGFAQINSEHCRHKIFGGTFVIDGKEMPSSLFAMIKKTTNEHPNSILSAYKDNVAFAKGPEIEQFAPKDQTTSDWFDVKKIESVISLKAETHNFPTTVEPFNGASTGTGGEIRDRMAGGTGSWPIAGTAVYMTAYPRKEGALMSWEEMMPVREWLYQSPEQILIKASNGASDFGNKFGQPLICGSVLTFEHQEKPVNTPKYAYDKVIMLAGGIGYGTKRDCLKKAPQTGNKIVVVGGDNYRIGLGGGSVSSVDTGRYSNGIELNAIQRANPEMQKRAYNLVRALCEGENNPVVSIHDHGSAGHLNCLSELVEECGGKIDMSQLPVGDKTLSAKEIIANESQERMGLLIDEKHIDSVRKIAERERAPMYVVGETTGDAHFAFVQNDGKKPFDLDVAQMFGHSPKTVMRDENVEHHYEKLPEVTPDKLDEYIQNVLQLEAVACKDWLTNKVDRSVTGKIARQQCQGKIQLPLSDCGVVALDYRGTSGIATALGHAPQVGLVSPEAGSVLSVAEALTNIVWSNLSQGLSSVSLSANWMWPCRSQKGEDARLYRAVSALSDFCCELGINVPTGKDSLSMSQQYPNGEKVISPGTVIVSAGGEVADVKKTVSPVLVNDRDTTLLHIDFSFDKLKLGGSALAQTLGKIGDEVPTVKNAEYFAHCFNFIQELVAQKRILAGHDISAGGMITTLLEMCFANPTGGIDIQLQDISDDNLVKILFAENPGIIIQIADADKDCIVNMLKSAGIAFATIGKPMPEQGKIVVNKGEFRHEFDVSLLRDCWYRTSYLLDRRQSLNGNAEKRYENYKKQPIQTAFPKDFSGNLSQYGEVVNGRLGNLAENIGRNPLKDRPKAAIIREKGTNGEREMAYMLYLSGFDVKDVTMTDLISGRETLDGIQLIVFCGGFSNSDVLGSAKGWAGAFLFNPVAKATLDRFYARKDTLSLGICNGCQLMVELGLIDGKPTQSQTGEKRAKMLHNASQKFESAFLSLDIMPNDSIMMKSLSGSRISVWVAHGEGKFQLSHQPESQYHIVSKYTYSSYPGNPNGSDYDVAAICSKDGRHLAMMPHLERAFMPWQCAWYPENRRQEEVTPWIEAFVNARRWIESHPNASKEQ